MMLLLIFVVALILYRLWTQRKVYYLAWQMNGPIGYPLIGNTLSFIDPTNVIDNLEKLKTGYDSPCKMWAGNRLIVFIDKVEQFETILNHPDCLDKGESYRYISDVIGHGLITLRSVEWKHHRKLLNPSFQYKIVNSFGSIFNDNLKALVFNLNNMIGEHNYCKLIDILEPIQQCSLDIICETTMDTKPGDNKEYTKALHTCTETVGVRIFQPWVQPDFLFRLSKYFHPLNISKNILNKTVSNIIQKKRKNCALLNNGPNVVDEQTPSSKFIDRILRLALEQDAFTLDEILGETNTILAAGYETMATTVSNVLLMLALHPHFQEQLHDELNQISLVTDVTADEIANLPFLDMVIKETMRLYPSVPYLTRKATKDMRLGKFCVPRGTEFVLGVIYAQRSGDNFKNNPKQFDPYNFLPANVAERHPYSFLPFSAGIRGCIAVRYANVLLKMMIIYVVKHFRLTTELKIDELQFRMNITLVMVNKHLVTLHRRDKQTDNK